LNKVEARRARVRIILPILKRTFPDAHCRLDHETPLQLLVATILSAQCTDDRVNVVTRTLFKKYRTARDFAAVPQEQLERDVQSTGFFRNKARSIREMAQSLVDLHKGQVPRTMEELTQLAGVGRKTANVVLGNAFGLNEGIVVDTHVTRLSQRLELTTHTDAVKIEQDLIPLVPREDWTIWPHLLIHHGRRFCMARNPACEPCPLREHCPSAENFLKARLKKMEAKKRRSPLGVVRQPIKRAQK
jgi:endonuclease-3